MSMDNNHGPQNGESHHHITAFSTYVKVAASLFALTFLTVIAHHFQDVLGVAAAPVAFAIATIKALLVMLWFMHLKHDTNMNRIIFGITFFFLATLLAFSGLDIWTRVVELSTL
jgi:cytochrome c oxidase subunit 4